MACKSDSRIKTPCKEEEEEIGVLWILWRRGGGGGLFERPKPDPFGSEQTGQAATQALMVYNWGLGPSASEEVRLMESSLEEERSKSNSDKGGRENSGRGGGGGVLRLDCDDSKSSVEILRWDRGDETKPLQFWLGSDLWGESFKIGNKTRV
ncbi:hypothetical protein L1987_22076 [Smallanthus sonchifolius]|uniref:Uncharacterized protein n=1 Tax=Smallanthus sonchifolius TaxID=185202 RepID=A0ACB9IFM1_9ASTR|nr:hypothetical protein L1987_22076 [Smallanthus sonchifolius]